MLRFKRRGNNGVTHDGLCDVIMQIPLTMNERNSRLRVSRSQGRERRHEAYGAPLVIQIQANILKIYWRCCLLIIQRGIKAETNSYLVLSIEPHS